MKKKATAAIVAVLVVASLGVGYYSGSLTRSAETSSTQTSTFPSETSASSLSITPINLTKAPSTELPTDEGWYVQACNCSVDLSQKAWPEYATMHDLASASIEVVVGQVTAEQTTGVNDSLEFGRSVPLVPVTDYNVTVTAIALNGESVWTAFGLPPPQVGNWMIVPQVGGTFDSTTMNDTGYPALTVGASYVFFLTDTTPIEGVYNARLITTGGAQGLFYVQDGDVYSLDNMYPQVDGWLPVKADGVPLYEFLTGVQIAYLSTTSTATSTASTLAFGECWPDPPGANSTTPSQPGAYYNVTAQFDSRQWNGTSFSLGGYTIEAVGYSGTPQNYSYAQLSNGETEQALNEVVLEVSNGQTTQNMTFLNLAGQSGGQPWPPDFPQNAVGVFNTHVVVEWLFTCDKRVFLAVAINP